MIADAVTLLMIAYCCHFVTELSIFKNPVNVAKQLTTAY